MPLLLHPGGINLLVQVHVCRTGPIDQLTTSVPKNIANGGLGRRLGRLHAHIDARYLGPRYVNQQFWGVPEGLETTDYTATYIGLSDAIPFRRADAKIVRLALKTDNAFNQHYAVAATDNSDYYGNLYLSVLEGMPCLYAEARRSPSSHPSAP